LTTKFDDHHQQQQQQKEEKNITGDVDHLGLHVVETIELMSRVL